MAQSTIKTDYAVEKVNVALASQSTWTVQKLTVYRWGKLVQVVLEASTSDTTVGDFVTLATGMPATQTGYINAYFHDTGTWANTITSIRIENGRLDVRNNSRSNNCKIDTTFVYICE